MAKEFGHLKNIANIGDIVVVKGYPGRKFRVESYTHELDFQPDYIEETILYDVADERTGEYLLAFQEDVTVIRRLGKATNYEYTGGMTFESREEESEMRPVELTKQERIDRLLTEINDYQYLIQNFGDENNEYKTKIEYAMMQLEGLVEKKQKKEE